MPQITVNRKMFEELVGKELPVNILKDRISMLGTDLDEVTDSEIKVEIFPNRPDMLSEQGFARAFSSFIGVKKGLRKYEVKKSDYKVIIDDSVKKVRPYTACAIIKGLEFDDEKIREVIQVQEKLHISYGRNRKRVAIGIYPLEKISLPITYTAKKPQDIKFRPLEVEKITETNTSSTAKLFWENPYLSHIKAEATHIDGKKVKLDQTIIYAFSGGQESDSGKINGINIINAVKQGDKESIIDIEYELEKEPDFKVGEIVEVEIDTLKRSNLMRLHSAAHIAYYIIAEKFGKLKIIGSNITSEKARIDFEYDKPLNEVLPEIQQKINEFIQECYSIEIKNDNKNPDLKWWHCKDWKMPCGGTHTKNTEEIGKIQLKRKNIGAGKERIEIYLTEEKKLRFETKKEYSPVSRVESSKEMTAAQILENHPTGKEYRHLLEGKEVYPLFIDSKNKVLSMPPIINSHDIGKVTENTKDVFVECSGFNFDVLSRCLNFIVTALSDMGGEIYEMHLEYKDGKKTTPNLAPRKMKADHAYINKLLGLELKDNDFKKYFEQMGYDYNHGEVSIPAWRADILHQADLAEDVAIAYGYENFEETIPNVATIGHDDSFESFKNKILEILVGLGYLETNTFSIINKVDQTKNMLWNHEVVELQNSVSEEYDSLRAWMIPSLMNVLKNNKHHEYPQNIFEAGRVFTKNKDTETGVEEEVRLAVLLCAPDSDYTKIRQILDLIFEAISQEYTVEDTIHESFVPGRVARIRKDKHGVAYIGEIHPQVLENFAIETPVAALELNLTQLYAKLLKAT